MKHEDKVKIYKKIFKFFFIILSITFLTLYFSEATGYYEYEQNRQTTFTNEQIKKFEKDVANGKNVDINNYLDNSNKDYSNKVSELGYKVSDNLGKYVRLGIEGAFGALNKLVEQ